MAASDTPTDLEMGPVQENQTHEPVSTLSWHGLNVTAKERTRDNQVHLLADCSGIAHAGQMLAIMGPSGSGKTTLLNVLAHRVAAASATTKGEMLVNGCKASSQMMRELSCYVEQEDALIGSLTVKETMVYAARLSLTSNEEVARRIDDLIDRFGLHSQVQSIVGTPMRKGLSGGQKRRLSIASRLVTDPRILFLDEPTSGLDSALSFEVCSYLRQVCRINNLIVVASIHQPSSATFNQFDSLCLLSGGRTCYFGPVSESTGYFSQIGYPVHRETNPAEFFLDLINTDLDKDGSISQRTDAICESWISSKAQSNLQSAIDRCQTASVNDPAHCEIERPRWWTVVGVLLHRSWRKSYRDAMVYGVRIAMYLALAILMGTVFLRLGSDQKYVQTYIFSLFFAGAFMSFMAVAYVPAFLEDLNTFRQEQANGLVGPLAFVVSNFIIGIPFLFLICVLYSVVGYWLMGFHANARSFFKWILWLFLELVAAESLVVLVSSAFHDFVVALAATAFANAVWMCVAGALIPVTTLNAFWKNVFHYIDYQAYAFKGMMVNEFQHREYECEQISRGRFQCSYLSDLNSEGKFRGVDVLQQFGINASREWTWVGITMGIIVGHRILAYLVLVWHR